MKQVLLIDDDAALSAPLATYLARFDMRLQAEVLPSAGLARLHSEPFDAVILDVMLPEMDGFELCRQIRLHIGAQLPIFILTARG